MPHSVNTVPSLALHSLHSLHVPPEQSTGGGGDGDCVWSRSGDPVPDTTNSPLLVSVLGGVVDGGSGGGSSGAISSSKLSKYGTPYIKKRIMRIIPKTRTAITIII